MDTRIDKEYGKIPVQIPANGQDWANYTARFGGEDVQIQANIQIVLELEHRLDVERLCKAVWLSVEAEPVLGCCFVEHPRQPYWKRMDTINITQYCLFEETDDGEASLQAFLAEALNPCIQPMQVKLLRTPEKDILCIKLDHACCDGGGAQEYVHLLADIYSCLCRDECYIPATGADSNRGADTLFTALAIPDPRMAWDPQQAALQPTWAFPHMSGKPQEPRIALRRFSQPQLAAMTVYAESRGVTLNDIILTAYYRALFTMLTPPVEESMEIYVTVDLRRYLPQKKAEALCNLSGVMNVRVSRHEGEAFEGTLERIAAIMRELKGGRPGLHSAASMKLMEGMGFQGAAVFLCNVRQKAAASRKASPLLSNMGVLAAYPLCFGTIAVLDAYMVTPPMLPPSFMLGVSTYNGILTLAANYYIPVVEEKDVDTLMNLMQAELLSCSE